MGISLMSIGTEDDIVDHLMAFYRHREHLEANETGELVEVRFDLPISVSIPLSLWASSMRSTDIQGTDYRWEWSINPGYLTSGHANSFEHGGKSS